MCLHTKNYLFLYLANCIFMKHTGKIGHLFSIFMMENGLPAHAGMWDGLFFSMMTKRPIRLR